MESRSRFHEHVRPPLQVGVMLTCGLIANDKCNLLAAINRFTKNAFSVGEKAP